MGAWPGWSGPLIDFALHTPRRMPVPLKAALLAMTAALAASLATAQPAPEDPYVWLEALSSPRAIAFVDQHNAATEKALTADPRLPNLFPDSRPTLPYNNHHPQPYGACTEFRWTVRANFPDNPHHCSHPPSGARRALRWTA